MSNLGPKPKPLRERLMRGIKRDDRSDCWHWTSNRNRLGYGLMLVNRKMVQVHRVSFEVFKGPIPQGLEIDHVKAFGCTARDCFNPDHLEAVTHAENMRRARPTHCKQGHQMSPENVREEAASDGTRRRCLTCQRAKDKKRYRRSLRQGGG